MTGLSALRFTHLAKHKKECTYTQGPFDKFTTMVNRPHQLRFTALNHIWRGCETTGQNTVSQSTGPKQPTYTYHRGFQKSLRHNYSPRPRLCIVISSPNWDKKSLTVNYRPLVCAPSSTLSPRLRICTKFIARIAALFP